MIPFFRLVYDTMMLSNIARAFCVQDVEGLALKILESMYGTTLKFSSRGQRTVKVTLNVRQSLAEYNAAAAANASPIRGHHLQPTVRERKSKTESRSRRDDRRTADDYDPVQDPEYQEYGAKGSPHQRIKSGAQRYRRDQLVEMVQRSLAENLSFQNLR
jgi:hypothetical protein